MPLLRLIVMQHQGSLHFSLVWVLFNAGTFSCTWCSSWLKNMLTHTYPHKPIRKMTMAIGNHQTDCSVNMKHDVWIGDFQTGKNDMVMHDRIVLTETTCHKQHKTLLFHFYVLFLKVMLFLLQGDMMVLVNCWMASVFLVTLPNCCCRLYPCVSNKY